MATTRAHVVLPEDLLREVDRLAGRRKRSLFVEQAIREKLRREAQRTASREAAGALKAADYPEWETPEKTSEWVRTSRRVDDERLARKLRGREAWRSATIVWATRDHVARPGARRATFLLVADPYGYFCRAMPAATPPRSC